jgi:hypothetical protein
LNILAKAQPLCLQEKEQSNMGAEIGANFTLVMMHSMSRYLRSTDRADVADAADKLHRI